MQKYLVKVPVADLRKEPIAHRNDYTKDPLQESQLIFNEKVFGIEEHGPWVKIEAIEQKKWDSRLGWKGYPGWVLKDQLQPVDAFMDQNGIVDSLWQPIYTKPQPFDLKMTVPFGTTLTIIDELADFWVLRFPNGQHGFTPKTGIRKRPTIPHRQDICSKSELFLNAPYLWGGRSAFINHIEWGITSVDCSGLTHLVYRVNGLDIPRDAHDQFLKCTQKEYDHLQPGDLIFSADRSKPERITHVMIHLGTELMMESSIGPQCVRKITLMEKFGISGKGMKSGCASKNEVIYFGSLFQE